MRIRTDGRSRDVDPADKAEQYARKAFREIADHEVTAALALATIERSRSYVRSGFRSVYRWAEDVGYGPQQIHRLLRLGRTLLEAPELTPKVRDGVVTTEAAIAVGRVLGEPALNLTPDQRADWIERAESVPPRELREAAEQAVEEARQGEPTFAMRFRVTKITRDGFRRARLLMSRGKPRCITEGEAFGNLVEEWLARNDPMLVPLPQRRSGPTHGCNSRYIPRRVRAEVERRSGGICEVCRCRRARHKIHVRVPHAEGGSREVDNLADACTDCHAFVDAGVLVFSHFDERGCPHWDFRPGPILGEDQVHEDLPIYGARPFG